MHTLLAGHRFNGRQEFHLKAGRSFLLEPEELSLQIFAEPLDVQLRALHASLEI